MFTSETRTDNLLPGLWPNSAAGLSSPTSLGEDPAGLGGSFDLMMMQVLLRLIDRLDTAKSATGAGNPAAGAGLASDSTPRPPASAWIYPTPITEATAARQAYAQPLTAPAVPAAPAAKAAAAAPAPAVAAPVEAAPPVHSAPATAPMTLADFPHPPGDNGRGMHWIPTTATAPGEVDRFVNELKTMKIKWVTLLNEGAAIGPNDYLVQQLKANGIEPVMRIYTPGLQPISGNLAEAVRHYKSLGVSYFQLYNEPNHSIENDGRQPDVNRYLDLWIPAARTVVENGGLPGFGALSPGGEFKDSDFLSQALAGLKERGEQSLLDRAWLSIHNYQGDSPVQDTHGFSRFKVYADILQRELGRVMPMIGTEGGSFAAGPADEPRRIGLVTDAYRYMAHREPYNFAYSYWVIANQAGGGHDSAWEAQALIHPDGQSPLVDALTNLQ